MTAVTDTAALAAIGAAARELKLPTIRADAARLAEIAVRQRQTHLAYLAEILSAEVDDRASRRRARRIGEARFPRLKRLADFNPDHVPGIAAQLATLATGAWIDAGEPVVALGDSGTGKTHLLIGLGLAACEQGRRVRYATTAALVNELAEAAGNRQLSRVVARYGRLDLLLLDELGYVQLDPRGAELLFQIITERDERASIALATNLPFSKAHMFARTCVRWRLNPSMFRHGGEVPTVRVRLSWNRWPSRGRCVALHGPVTEERSSRPSGRAGLALGRPVVPARLTRRHLAGRFRAYCPLFCPRRCPPRPDQLAW